MMPRRYNQNQMIIHALEGRRSNTKDLNCLVYMQFISEISNVAIVSTASLRAS